MRLVFTPDQYYVESKEQLTPLNEFVEARRKQAGISASQIETLAGLSHPNYTNFMNGSVKSLTTAIAALDVLGYDIFIFGAVEAGKEQ